MTRLDELRPSGIIAKRLPQFLDTRSQRGVAHSRAGPHCAKELFFGDYLSCPRGEFPEKAERLRADTKLFTVAPEPLGTVHHKGTEANPGTLVARTEASHGTPTKTPRFP